MILLAILKNFAPFKQGEHLSLLAKRHGHTDWEKVWLDGENAELRNERKDAHILNPGDSLFLPEVEVGTENAPTEELTRFRLKSKSLHLDLDVSDFLANLEEEPSFVALEADGVEREVEIKDGRIKESIPVDSDRVLLRIDELSLEILVGHLDPPETEQGQRQTSEPG